MSQSQQMALKVQEKLVTRLFLSPKLRQNLKVLSYGANDLKKVLEDFNEENPFVRLKSPKNQLQNLDWIGASDSENLVDHLLGQIRLEKWNSKDKRIVTFLVYQLDRDGYLRINASDLAKQTEFSRDEIKQGLEKLHSLDPIGVGAFDLNECLLIQAKQIEFNPIAFAILQKHELEKLAQPDNWNDFPYSKTELLAALKAIQTLNPTPASSFDSVQVQYLIPDLRYQFEEERLSVTTARADLPEIIFDEENFANMQKISVPEDKKYFRKQKRDFTELQQSLAEREQTLLRLGKYVGKIQTKYLKSLNSQDLVSLNMAQTARDLNLAVSTISRAIKDKYVECQGKVFSLRILFAKKSVGNLTQNQIEGFLRQLIDSENKNAPLSDDQIVANLQKNNINLSRRTVTKYRKRLGIKNSYQRKNG